MTRDEKNALRWHFCTWKLIIGYGAGDQDREIQWTASNGFDNFDWASDFFTTDWWETSSTKGKSNKQKINRRPVGCWGW
jgi:hypothetical protein